MRTVSQESGDEKGRGAKREGESYFWFLSRKSNLRSLTPKELQMHGRQHTGVSIYEARTETREKDERSCRSDGETADGEMGIRQIRRKIEKESARETKIRRCCGESLDERAQQPWVRSFASFTHHPRAKTRIFHPRSGPSP